MTSPQMRKKLRVSRSGELLRVVKAAEKDYYRFLITGDESWFFYSTPPQGCWCPADSPGPTAQKATHFAPKIMITIFWNPNGIVLICALPADKRWTAEYFISEVLRPLTTTFEYRRTSCGGYLSTGRIVSSGALSLMVATHTKLYHKLCRIS